MNYYEKIVVGVCVLSLLVLAAMTQISYPTYEFYISNFSENETHYIFDLVLNGDESFSAPIKGGYIPGVQIDIFLNNEYSTSSYKKCTTECFLTADVNKFFFNEGQNKVEFRYYTEDRASKEYGSFEKPYIIYKWIEYEKD